MSSLAVTQFEVLEWVWNLSGKYDCPQEFRDHIKKFLMLIADDGSIDFAETLKELNRGDW